MIISDSWLKTSFREFVFIKLIFLMAASRRTLNHRTRVDILNIFECNEPHVLLPHEENTDGEYSFLPFSV